MRRSLRLLLLLAIALFALTLAACNGGKLTKVSSGAVVGAHSSQRIYVTPYGIQAHAPDFGKPPPASRKTATAPKTVATTAMYDSVDVFAVPSWATAVAGYTAGYWPTYNGLVQRFPHAYHVSIAISIFYAARCLDVEAGDASPSQVVYWFHYDQAHGFAKPCFYASLANGMSSVAFNLRNAGIPRSAYWLWDADWTYTFHLDNGFDCSQISDHASGNNDLSDCTLAFLGAQPTPPRVHCFGPHWDRKAAKCKVIRPEVARRTREWNHIHRVSVFRFKCMRRVPFGRVHGVNYRRDFCERLFLIEAADTRYIDANLY